MPAFWVGIDSGKRAHHCVVIDQTGTVLLSKRVENDENAVLELIATIAEIAAGGEVCWATDLNSGGAALLIELLAAHAQQLLYIPGRIVHHAAETYRGDGKTDAKDARIIADQARMRTDLQPVRRTDQISVDLRLLTARRTDLICDRVRAINRLRATLLEYFPALERAFDYSKQAPLVLLGGYQTPEGIRRIGLARLTGWLRKRGCRNSAKMAEKALIAANSQHTVLPTQTTGSALVVRLAGQISTLDAEIAGIDAQITDLFGKHDSADVLLTMPGFGPVLAATFLANIGGNLDAFDSVDRLASVAGLAPVPRDSGRISGNLHRPRRFNRRLLRTCYLAALSSLKNSAASRTYYDRKRGEGKSHKQALIALARRRINVLWAMLRDHTIYQEPMPRITAQAA
ncbi:transposase (plasmid) [Pseudarthrobacter phenanthrenivorans Sphe3]|uniref:Transposase n=1 Tax=Pseudarthrobacter phenanthrenivorans (strain DSM 18606 / JCM 16027 / LMG 23796 / Sphe3) TaxID=930171 RepID=F0M171_PSEPM|nr:IS110 family transposase [Pseudarthrobacter phenanthrenivorans]ADX71397.1 transposase [Pseudarthrobacter phenanthrenivorans Sphe3]ADX71954.1 transposase [Pseudarthrobacter phenanthrenivorans Sphe3]ADX73679.1 transposase [Pseudarthrobacter phenanthrenivorans Sphe3]ADX74264.1 transposase [Pseudarthrobacter phenanthrenivorans Sphe3]ADX74850.1 transposase [Pseudarthrobacter phenanthrenivorans Sphe3]